MKVIYTLLILLIPYVGFGQSFDFLNIYDLNPNKNHFVSSFTAINDTTFILVVNEYGDGNLPVHKIIKYNNNGDLIDETSLNFVEENQIMIFDNGVNIDVLHLKYDYIIIDSLGNGYGIDSLFITKLDYNLQQISNEIFVTTIEEANLTFRTIVKYDNGYIFYDCLSNYNENTGWSYTPKILKFNYDGLIENEIELFEFTTSEDFQDRNLLFNNEHIYLTVYNEQSQKTVLAFDTNLDFIFDSGVNIEDEQDFEFVDLFKSNQYGAVLSKGSKFYFIENDGSFSLTEFPPLLDGYFSNEEIGDYDGDDPILFSTYHEINNNEKIISTAVEGPASFHFKLDENNDIIWISDFRKIANELNPTYTEYYPYYQPEDCFIYDYPFIQGAIVLQNKLFFASNLDFNFYGQPELLDSDIVFGCISFDETSSTNNGDFNFKKLLVNKYNFEGKKIHKDIFNKPFLNLYNDGSVEKKIIIE